MRMTRRYTTAGQDPYSSIKFVPRTSRISNPDGSLVFEMKDILIPESWSQVAVDVIAQKYFRKAGVAQSYEKVPEAGIPVWLQRPQPVGGKIDGIGHETDSRQVFSRMAGCWTYWGWKGGYFGTNEADARAFYDELCYMLATQMAAPNSPQWFNTGLHWAYGIEGPPQGHSYVEPSTGKLMKATSATNAASHMLASSRVSAMISSMKAGSWTCGFVKPASSSMVPAPAPTSQRCVVKGKNFPAAASHQG